jgi:hypothetical protein
MFLASAREVPLRELAQDAKEVLGGEVRRQCGARSSYSAGVEADGLGGIHGVAVRTEEAGEIDGTVE